MNARKYKLVLSFKKYTVTVKVTQTKAIFTGAFLIFRPGANSVSSSFRRHVRF